MSTYIPITLVGSSLGERHRYLNGIVENAYKDGVPFESLQHLPELSPVDRLFKIDLASKCKKVDYIMNTLKDEDLLYVSRALKCLWFLQLRYSDIINPSYLEDELYPEMLTTAVNKMKHWIQLNLKDKKRNQIFYEYYKHKNDHTQARKHLLNCSAEYILHEVTVDMLLEFNVKYLIILFEKCPKLATLYIEGLNGNSSVVKHYLDNEMACFEKLKFLLKVDPDTYLDYIEYYFNYSKFSRLNSEATKYMIKFFKNRFIKKPELYTAWLLDLKTLSKMLSPEEIKQIILKLATAEYLGSWFSYKNLEVLLKRLSIEDRTAFKKQIFVEKTVGEIIKDWPYRPPASPVKDNREDKVFLDVEPDEYDSVMWSECDDDTGCVLRERFLKRHESSKIKTELDRLFDYYRFTSFRRTFYELRKLILAESSGRSREYMMLVLVSKSGAQADQVEELLRWLVARHSNEPATVRATVVRSLVKRATVWRLEDNSWKLFLQFAAGLGLDGGPASPLCREGLHAAMLRNLLRDVSCNTAILNAFLRKFSTLKEYSVEAFEQQKIRQRLPSLVLIAAKISDCPAERFCQLLDTLSAYRLRLSDCAGAIEAIISFAKSDPSAARSLLQRIFNSKDARKELFEVNLKLLPPTDHSYCNALRHNPELLTQNDIIEALFKEKNQCHEQFFKKLSIFFSEKDDITAKYLAAIKIRVKDEPQNKLARPLAMLDGHSLNAWLKQFDSEPKKSVKRRFSAALRANGHMSRPPLNINALGWRSAGAKAVANKVSVCAAKNLTQLLPMLLVWQSTVRLALLLTERLPCTEVSVLEGVATVRPSIAIRAGLKHFKRLGEESNMQVWTLIKPLIERLDNNMKSCQKLYKSMLNFEDMPSFIGAEYWPLLYKIFANSLNVDDYYTYCILNHMVPFLDKVNENFLSQFVDNVIQKDLIAENLEPGEKTYQNLRRVHYKLRFICISLLMCKSKQMQLNRVKALAEPIFNKLEVLCERSKFVLNSVVVLLDQFMKSLKFRNVWFDPEYVDLILIFDTVEACLQKILPLEQYFCKFACLHLTKLFYKSVQECIKQKPQIFKEKGKEHDRVDCIGRLFGKYLAYEMEELTKIYFPTVRVLYQNNIEMYFETYLNDYDSKQIFINAVIRGITEQPYIDTINAQIMAAYMLINKAPSASDIIKNLKKLNNQEINFVLGTNVIPIW